MTKRRIVFYVMTMEWDNVYSTYYAKELGMFNEFEEADDFCRSYDGNAESIFIQKAYEKSK